MRAFSVSVSVMVACLASPLLGACGGVSGGSISGSDGAAGSAGSGGSGGGAGAGGSGGGGGSGGSSPASPQVSVRILAEQTPVPSTDGASRETPSDQRVGILGLELLRSATDPSPLVVLKESQPVDTGYNAGDGTLVGTTPASKLTAGTYVFARVPVAYVKFTVAGTYHTSSLAVPGQFSDTISLSAQTMLDGALRDQGWWTDTFLVSGMAEGTATGEGADFGQPGATSGIRLDLSQSTAAYVFPVSLVIDPDVGHDVTIAFTLNTYEDFHWVDESASGYTKGVFDVAAGTFEPVTQLGANSFSVTME